VVNPAERRDAARDPKREHERTRRHGVRLHLVRHGETEWARLGRHTGLTDVALTAAGRAQARAIAARLDGLEFDAVLSSPSSRALDTARLAGFGEVVQVEPDLHEWDYGAWEGLTTPQIRRRMPGWRIWTHGADGGESAADVTARVDRVLARSRRVGGDVALFAHGHVLRALAVRWLGLDVSEGRLLALGTATVSVLGWERDQPVIEQWNESCHLP
jgi:broad specificity phosphatase PhoE